MKKAGLIFKLLPPALKRKIENNQQFRKILSNTNWLSSEKLIRLVLGIIVSAFVARYLEPGGFGMMNYALAFASLFLALNKLGLDKIVVRNIVLHPDKKKEYLGTSLILKLTSSFLSLLLALGIIMLIQPESELMWAFVAIIGAGHFFRSLDVIDFWFQSQIRSKFVVYSRSAAFFAASGLKIMFVFTQQPLIAFIFVFLIEAVIAMILLITFYEIKAPFSILSWKIKLREMKVMMKDSWPLILGGLAVAVYMKIDQVMIGSMAGNSELGIYSAAVKLSEAWYFLPTIISSSVFPAILSARKKNKDLYMGRLQLLYDFFTWLTIIIALFISLLSPFIISLIYGAEYNEATLILSLHIWGGIFVFLGVASSNFLIAENLTKVSLYRTIFGAVMNVILNLLLIPFYGIIGAAIATLVSYMCATFFILIPKESRSAGIQLIRSFNLTRVIKHIK